MFRKTPSKGGASAPPKAKQAEDDIDLQSTEDSEHSDDHAFEVECVLAEKKVASKALYLLRWKGYPDERATWEPRRNIFDNSILENWADRKRLEEDLEANVPSYDVAAYEEKVKKLRREKADRHSRREAKRVRLQHLDSDSDSSDEALEAKDIPKDDVRIKKVINSTPGSRNSGKVPASKSTPQSSSKLQDNNKGSSSRPSRKESVQKLQLMAEKTNVSNNKQVLSDLSSDTPTSGRQRTLGESLFDSGSDLDSDIPFSGKSNSGTVTSTNTQPTITTSKPNTSMSTSIPTLPAGRGAGASSSVAPQNVFAPRSDGRKKKPTLLETSADPNNPEKHYKNMRILRKAELAGREKADAAPDVNAIGGLFKPSEVSLLQPLNLSELRKSSASTATTLENERLAMQQASEKVANPQPAPQYSGKSICYYWSRPNGSCTQGYLCSYLHSREPGIPIAPRPGDSHTSQSTAETQREENIRDIPSERHPDLTTKVVHRQRCSYFETLAGCNRGSDCKFMHTYDHSIPLAPGPPKVNKTCQFWAGGGCSKLANDCSYIHGIPGGQQQPQQLPQPSAASSRPGGPGPKRVSFAVDEPVQPTQPAEASQPSLPALPPSITRNSAHETCKLWLRGGCHNGENCRDAHQLPAGTASDSLPGNRNPTPRTAISNTHEGGPISREIDLDAHGYAPLEIPPPQIESPNLQDSEFDAENRVMPTSDAELMPKPKAKPAKSTSLAEYNRKQKIKKFGSKAKTFIFGIDNKRPLILDAGDLDQDAEQILRQKFSSISEFHLKLLCIAQDFQVQSDRFVHGPTVEGLLNLVDTSDSSLDSEYIGQVVEHMRIRSSGLVCTTDNYNVLVYPARTEEWGFMDPRPWNYPQDVRLKFFIFQSHLNIAASLSIPASIATRSLPPDPDKWRKALVHSILGNPATTIERLLLPNKNQEQGKNFFLLFPPSARESAAFIVAWLRASIVGLQIWNPTIPGSWKVFIKTPTFANGHVLIHESLINIVHKLPMLQDMFRSSKKHFSFWNISDSCPSLPLFPSDQSRDGNRHHFGELTATRLFPSGAAILLLPSFIVAEPEQTYVFLKWLLGKNGSDGKFYRGKIAHTTPGTWKLVVCFNFVAYMHDLAVSKAEERKRFMKVNNHLDSKDADAKKRGLSYETCELRFKIATYLQELELKGFLGEVDDDGDLIDEDSSPINYCFKYLDPDDDKALLEWFAGWAGCAKMDKFRKFIVIGINSSSLEKATRFKEVGHDLSSDAIVADLISKNTCSQTLNPQHDSAKAKRMANEMARTTTLAAMRSGGLDPQTAYDTLTTIRNRNDAPATIAPTTQHLSTTSLNSLGDGVPQATAPTPQRLPAGSADSLVALEDQTPHITASAGFHVKDNSLLILPYNTDTDFDAVSQGRRIQVSMLPRGTSKKDVEVLFTGYRIESITLPLYQDLSRQTIYAFVSFTTPGEAQRAISQLSGQKVLGYRVSITLSKPSDKSPDWQTGNYGASAAQKSSLSQLPPITSSGSNGAAKPNYSMDLDTQVQELIDTESRNQFPKLTTSNLSMNFSEHRTEEPLKFGSALQQNRPISSGTNSSKNSHSGIRTDEHGLNVVPKSTRPSGTKRKEIPIKPGFVLDEDIEVWKVRKTISGAPVKVLSATSASITDSRVVSPAFDFSPIVDDNQIDLESPSISPPVPGLPREPSVDKGKSPKVWKEIKFDSTTTYYRKLCEEGKGWNHIMVSSWLEGFLYAGLKQKL